jgi:hypothetical protein
MLVFVALSLQGVVKDLRRQVKKDEVYPYDLRQNSQAHKKVYYKESANNSD